MASENKFSTPPSISSASKIKTNIPHFPICGMLRVIESGEDEQWDDSDWQDYLSQYADRGVRP